MSDVGGYDWTTAGELDLTGVSQPTTPNPGNTPDDSWWHPAWWKFTAPADGMIALDLDASTVDSGASTYLAAFTGSDYATSVNVEYNDGFIDPDGDPSTYVPQMHLFVQAGVEYHLIAGIWNDPPSTVTDLVVTSKFHAAGPGVPGPTWDDAGVIEAGRQSVEFNANDVANEFWFKFTPDFTGWAVFDAESSSTRSYVGRENGGVEVTFWSGPDVGSGVIEADWSNRPAVGYPFGINVALGAFQVEAGTEYHVQVQNIFDMWEVVLGVSQGVFSDGTQPDDETNQRDTSPSDTPGKASTVSYSPADVDGTRTTAELQTDLNDAIAAIPGFSSWAGGLAQAQGEINASAFRYKVTFASPVRHGKGAIRSNLSYGIRFADGADPYSWFLDPSEYSADAAAVDYDNDGLTTYVDTRLDYGIHIYTQIHGTMDVPAGCDFNISPSPYPDGAGRTFYSASWSGNPPYLGDETPDYGSDYLTAGDTDVDGIIYITPQGVSASTWTGAVATADANNENVSGDLKFLVSGPSGYGYPQRFDTHVPPQWRFVLAGPTSPYPSFVARPPARRIFPRDDTSGPGRGRDWPPPTTQQYGRRGGPGAPV